MIPEPTGAYETASFHGIALPGATLYNLAAAGVSLALFRLAPRPTNRQAREVAARHVITRTGGRRAPKPTKRETEKLQQAKLATIRSSIRPGENAIPA